MAILSVVQISRAGVFLATSGVAAAGGGDSFPNDGSQFYVVKNGSGAPITVTLVGGTGYSVDSQAPANRTVSVPAGDTACIGPFPTGTYNDANGRMNFTYSGVTSLTVMPVKFVST